MSDSLRVSFTRAEAARNLAVYKRLLAIVLTIEGISGLVAVVAPSLLLGLLSTSQASSPLARLWGLGSIVAVALYCPGYLEPIAAKWPNAIGILARAGAALLCCLLGGGMLWLALFEFAAAVALGWTWWRLLLAELMSRP
jgi:hypothetical protein